MNGGHLTDEQLSARLDGALDAAEEARIDAHLAGCEACSARLAEWSALDESVGRALEHDPGDAYFADFSDRVAARIAAEPAAPAARPRGLAWLFTPRGLAFAGSAAVLVAAVGLGLQWYSQRGAVVGMLTEGRAREEARGPAAIAPPQGAALEQSRPPETSASEPPSSTPPATAERSKLREAPSAGASLRQQPAPAAALTRDDAAVRSQESAPAGAVQSLTAPAPAAASTESENRAPRDDAPATGAPVPIAKPSAPATDARARVSEALSKSMRASSPLQKSLAGSTAAPAPAEAKKETGFSSDGLSGVSTTDELGRAIENCGSVRDSRGQPLAAAQVRVSGAQPANTRSGADGTFCFDAIPLAGDTLIVMRVGFDPVRRVIDGSNALTVVMEPVGTLGSAGGLLTGSRTAPTPDVYAKETAAVRAAVEAVRARAALAARERTAASFDAVSAAWDDIAARTQGAATYDARFRSLAAMRDAFAIAGGAERRDRLRAALEAFVAATPRTLPERATVGRWLQELPPR